MSEKKGEAGTQTDGPFMSENDIAHFIHHPFKHVYVSLATFRKQHRQQQQQQKKNVTFFWIA
jgi:hypothetical protein